MGDEAPVPFDEAIARDIAPAAAILRYAEDHGVDLIVMGTHGRRGLPRLLLGSTAREVVQLAPCPVLTARSGTEDAATEGLRGGALLVAVDFSPASREALLQAVRLAEAFDARVDVVHVMDELFMPVGGYTLRAVGDIDPEVMEQQAEALRAFRDEVVGEAGGDAARFGSMEVVPKHAAADAITETAERLGSNLVILGTKGLRGLENLVMGSVAGAVMRKAPCPVLTVKAPEARASAREAIQTAREVAASAEGDSPLSIDSSLAF
jgi:nucleotide-binding universal stress UspA family protein